MGWVDFDIECWTALRDEARAGIRKVLPAPITGSDVRRDAIQFARQSARAAGIGHLVPFGRQELGTFRPPDGPPGMILCNPPYGERIGEEKDLVILYGRLGEVLRAHCSGWSACVFTASPTLAEALGITPTDQVPLFNGKIPCRLLKFRLA